MAEILAPGRIWVPKQREGRRGRGLAPWWNEKQTAVRKNLLQGKARFLAQELREDPEVEQVLWGR